MARKCKTNELWTPDAVKSASSISVIERGDPKDDRQGVPFGFGRVLFEEQQHAIAMGRLWLDEYERLMRPKTDGWEDFGNGVALL